MKTTTKTGQRKRRDGRILCLTSVFEETEVLPINFGGNPCLCIPASVGELLNYHDSILVLMYNFYGQLRGLRY